MTVTIYCGSVTDCYIRGDLLQSISARGYLSDISYNHDDYRIDTPQGGKSNFPYILLNEIQTMFSQLAKQSVRFQSADMPPTRAQMLHVPTELGR